MVLGSGDKKEDELGGILTFEDHIVTVQSKPVIRAVNNYKLCGRNVLGAYGV